MGTSGAYDGSPGWHPIRSDVDSWLQSLPDQQNPRSIEDQSNSTDDADLGSQETEEPETEKPEKAPNDSPINPHISRMVRRVARNLLRELSGDLGVGTVAASGNGGGRGRGRRRATIAGGVAIAGVHGLRTQMGEGVEDAGLVLDELLDLSGFEQARRIVDAATIRSASIQETELREVNANFVCWAIEQDVTPSPIDLVKRWVTEFVFQVWLTEAGERLRDGSRDGASTHALEREVRATLEARISGLEIPMEGMRAAHFDSAIRASLAMISRIFR